jgi:hypothetical protein
MVLLMKILLILLLACTSLFAQTKDDLRKKFGEPVSETFVVQPGITATVSYSENGRVREMLLMPQPSSNLIKSKQMPINYDLLRKVINELVPKEERGKSIGNSFLSIMCLPNNDCAGSSESYDKLTIYYNAGKDGANYAVIQWKKETSEK